MEEVGHADEVAVGGELVGDQLGVDEAVADDVGQDEDAGRRLLVGRVGEVGLGWRRGVACQYFVGFGGR